MAVRIIRGVTEGDRECAVLYCSTTMTAFGPILQDEQEAEGFLKYLRQDARLWPPNELTDALRAFRGEE